MSDLFWLSEAQMERLRPFFRGRMVGPGRSAQDGRPRTVGSGSMTGGF